MSLPAPSAASGQARSNVQRAGTGPRTAAERSPARARAAPTLVDRRPASARITQLSRIANPSSPDPPAAQAAPARLNRTGLPTSLKNGLEHLSGHSLDDVRVHRNSAKPAQLRALAYAQGSDIHLGPGQEKHLAHEAWHVVQQKQGRVRATRQMKSIAINAEANLEREADVMGRRAATTGAGPVQEKLPRSASAGAPVLQPMLGFEIEMLVLIDLNGRPIPEKRHVGTCGPHLTLDVDHGPSVAAPTITRAADARYDVDQRRAVVAPGAEVEMRRNGGPADPRLPLQELDPAAWAARTTAVGHQEFTRPASPIQPFVNNAALALIDAELPLYLYNYKNWEAARCRVNLTALLAHTASWLATNAAKPNKVTHPHWRARWRNVRNAVQALRVRAQAHLLFWNTPANAVAPANLRREYRPAAGPGAGAWHHYVPLAGQGTDRYASILEIVTAAYPPETAGGQANILAAMTAAATLAANLEAAGGAHMTTRVALNTIPNVVTGAGVHVGNPHQAAQTTAGSIQVTGALDLAQLPSYINSIAGVGGPGVGAAAETNTEFRLKHHSDFDIDEGRRVLDELPVAVANATAMTNAIKVYGGGGPAPDLVNLRGLLTLVCQYLRMGRHFYGHGGHPLDKNIVPLLSRTDLSQIYDRLVPPAEKAWLAGGGRLAHLIASLPAAANRNPATDLFNDDGQTHNGDVSCHTFVNNIFTAAADGVTGNLGGFRQLPAESVDPAAARGGDSRHAAAAQREGFVFEMRNMVSRGALDLGRFQRTRWVRLAEQQIGLFASLNARLEAAAAADQRTRWAGYGAAGGAHRLDVQAQNDPAW